MSVGVLDSGLAIAWIHGGRRSARRVDGLFAACRNGRIDLVISTVNLVEVFIHTAEWSRATGAGPLTMLKEAGVRVYPPDESIARRVARLPTSLADGFAAATAQELGARLHTTDSELVRQLRSTRLPVTHY